MFGEQRTGSMMCPGCGGLVGVRDEACYHCGRRNPGMWGLARVLRGASLEGLFSPVIMWMCGAAFIASLAVDPSAIGGSGGLLGILSPSGESLFLLGASGAVPVFGYGRWWTLLSAGWLHGGIIHIIFNMVGVRDLGPPTVHLYGVARTVIIYVVASAVGFATSSAAGAFLPGILRGAHLTVGASAALFGLMGAILHYGRRGGSAQIRAAARGWIIGGIAFGFVLPGIDNWAHLGGLAGGYLVSAWLDPLKPERGDHVVAAIVCLVASAAAVIASVVTAR